MHVLSLTPFSLSSYFNDFHNIAKGGAAYLTHNCREAGGKMKKRETLSIKDQTPPWGNKPSRDNRRCIH